MKKIIISLGFFEFLIILLVPFFLGNLFFVTPFYGSLNLIDEGQFLAWVSHMQNGKLMYRDIYITYGPLYVYPLYLVFKIFGSSIFIFRVYFIAFGIAVGILMIRPVVRLLNFNNMIRFLFIVYIVLIPGITIRHALPFLAILFLYKDHTTSKPINSILLGVVSAISFLVSQEIGLFVILGVLTYYFTASVCVENYKKYFEKLLRVCLGAFISFMFFWIWSSSEGWFDSYLFTTLDVLKVFSGMELPNGKGFSNPLSSLTSLEGIEIVKYIISKEILLFWEVLILIISTLYIFYEVISRKFNSQLLVLISVVMYGYFLLFSVVGRFGNFFLQLTPIIVICFYFINLNFYNLKKTRGSFPKVYSLFFIILIVLFLLRILLIFRPHFVHFNDSINAINNSSKNQVAGIVEIPEEQFEYLSKVVSYVKENSKEREYIFFLSNEPALYYLTDRLNPTRYDLPYIPTTIEKRYELLNDIKEKAPRIVLYDEYSWPVDEVSNIVRQPELISYLKSKYTEKLILNGRVRVYTLRTNENNQKTTEP